MDVSEKIWHTVCEAKEKEVFFYGYGDKTDEISRASKIVRRD